MTTSRQLEQAVDRGAIAALSSFRACVSKDGRTVFSTDDILARLDYCIAAIKLKDKEPIALHPATVEIEQHIEKLVIEYGRDLIATLPFSKTTNLTPLVQKLLTLPRAERLQVQLELSDGPALSKKMAQDLRILVDLLT